MASVKAWATQMWWRLPRSGWQAAALLAALTVALGLGKYGLGFYTGAPNLFEVTLHPWQPQLDPSQDFVLKNATLAFTLGVVGITNSTAWITIHVVLAIAAVASPFLFPQIWREPTRLRMVFLVMVGGPILPVILGWVGAYDALAVVGLSMAALSRSVAPRLIGWFLVGVTHAELGLVAAALVAAYLGWTAASGKRWRTVAGTLAVSLPPLVLWFLTTAMLVDSWGGATSRLSLALTNPAEKLYRWELVMPAMLFSVLGVTWLILLRRDVIRLRPSWTLAVVTLGLGLSFPLLFEDYTRVLGILVFPLVLSWILHLKDDVQDRLWRTFVAAAVIIPVPVFIAGTVGFGGIITFLTWRTVTQV